MQSCTQFLSQPKFSIKYKLRNCRAEGNQDVDVLQVSVYNILLLTKLSLFSFFNAVAEKQLLPIEMEFLAKDRTSREDDIVAAAEWDTEDIVQQAELSSSIKFKLKPNIFTTVDCKIM